MTATSPGVSNTLTRPSALALASPSAVRHLARRFQQHQARIRRRMDDAPATRFLHDRVKVGIRVEAEHRKLEAVLPPGIPVAAGRVAAKAAQKRLDVILEMIDA